MQTRPCVADNSPYRNKFDNRDCIFLLDTTSKECLDFLSNDEMLRNRKKQFQLNKWKTNLKNRADDLAKKDQTAMLPFKLPGSRECDPVVDCHVIPRKPIEYPQTNQCGPAWIPTSFRDSVAAPPETKGQVIGFHDKHVSDAAVLSELRGVLCRDIIQRFPKNYRISNALPQLPFPWADKPGEDYKRTLDHIYKSTARLASEDVPFDKSVYSRRLYPLSTLEKSADPLISTTYKRKTYAPTSTWQPSNIDADKYDDELLRRDFSCKSKPSSFCAELRRAKQISSYSGCITPKEHGMDISDLAKPYEPLTVVRSSKPQKPNPPSCMDNLRLRHEADRIIRNREVEDGAAVFEAERMKDEPCDLPGTYSGKIGTAIPAGWQLKSLTMEVDKDTKSTFEHASNLPEPECFCSRKKRPQPKIPPLDRTCCEGFQPDKYTC